MDTVAPPISTFFTNINYFLEIDQGGTDTVYPGTATDKLRPLHGVSMQMNDIRSCDDKFDLDVHGFALVQHKSAESKYEDKERIASIVYKEAEELMKELYVTLVSPGHMYM
jgi:hypothetical protein